MKIKGWMHIYDGGDGSAGVNFYCTEKRARKAADEELEEYGQSLCDNVVSFKFEVDSAGVVIDPKGG